MYTLHYKMHLYTIYLLTGVINPQLIETAQSEHINCESSNYHIAHILPELFRNVQL